MTLSLVADRGRDSGNWFFQAYVRFHRGTVARRQSRPYIVTRVPSPAPQWEMVVLPWIFREESTGKHGRLDLQGCRTGEGHRFLSPAPHSSIEWSGQDVQTDHSSIGTPHLGKHGP